MAAPKNVPTAAALAKAGLPFATDVVKELANFSKD